MVQPRTLRFVTPLSGVVLYVSMFQNANAQPPRPPDCPVFQNSWPEDRLDFYSRVGLVEQITESAASSGRSAVTSFKQKEDVPITVANVYFYLGDSVDQFTCGITLISPFLDSKDQVIHNAADKIRNVILKPLTRTSRLFDTLSSVILQLRPDQTPPKADLDDMAREAVSFMRESPSEYQQVQETIVSRILLLPQWSTDLRSVMHVLSELRTAFGDKIVELAARSPFPEPKSTLEVAAYMYRSWLIGPSQTCEDVADEVMLGEFHTQGSQYIRPLPPLLRDPAETLLKAVILRTVASVPTYLDAEVKQLKCDNGRYLVVLGKRLLFLSWQGAMLLSRIDSKPWPPDDVVDQYERAVRGYITLQGLDEVNTLGLQVAFAQAPVANIYRSTIESEVAELFVALHEVAHIPDLATTLNDRHLVTVPSGIEGDQKTEWSKELQADADALVWLWQTSGDHEGVCIGADIALGSLKLAEEISGSDLATHPPAEIRRSALASLCLALAKESALSDSDIEKVREALNKEASAFDDLQTALRRAHPDLFKGQ